MKPFIQKPFTTKVGENARVSVEKDLTGGIAIVLHDAKHLGGYRVRMAPATAIEFALTVLESAGIPIKATFAERTAELAAKIKAASPGGAS